MVLEQVEVRVDAARVVRLVAEELRLFGVCGQAATRAELRPMLAQVGVQSRTTFFGHIKWYLFNVFFLCILDFWKKLVSIK